MQCLIKITNALIMGSSESSWLLMFPNMSTGMKVQMVQNPPPTLSKPTLFRAILDLPYSERNKLIRSIAPPTLKSLILSLPKEQQLSFYNALRSATSSPPTPSRPNTRDRDCELQAALNLEPSKNGYFGVAPKTDTLIGRQPRGTKRKRTVVENGSHPQGSRHWKRESIELALRDIVAVSDYEDDVDRYPDRCAAHIDSAQFEREYFLPTMLRMMRASGDAPRPSRYSALILLNHIKAFLKCLIQRLEVEKAERGKTPRNKKKNEKKKKKAIAGQGDSDAVGTRCALGMVPSANGRV